MYSSLRNNLSPAPCIADSSGAAINKPIFSHMLCHVINVHLHGNLSKTSLMGVLFISLQSVGYCGIHPTANERELSHLTLNLFLVPKIRVELSYWADSLRYKLSLKKSQSKETDWYFLQWYPSDRHRLSSAVLRLNPAEKATVGGWSWSKANTVTAKVSTRRWWGSFLHYISCVKQCMYS